MSLYYINSNPVIRTVVTQPFGNFYYSNESYRTQLQTQRDYTPRPGSVVSRSVHNSVAIRETLVATAMREGNFDVSTGKFAEGYPKSVSYTVCPTDEGMTFNTVYRQQARIPRADCDQGELEGLSRASYIDVVIYASGDHVVMEAEGFIGDDVSPEMTAGTSTEGVESQDRYYNGWDNGTYAGEYWEMYWCSSCTPEDDSSGREDSINFYFPEELYLPLFLSSNFNNAYGFRAYSDGWGDQGFVASSSQMNLIISNQWVAIPPYYKGAFKNRAVLENTSLIFSDRNTNKQYNLMLDANLDTKIVSNAIQGLPISITVRSANVIPSPPPPASYVDLRIYESGPDLVCHLKGDLTLAQDNLRSRPYNETFGPWGWRIQSKYQDPKIVLATSSQGPVSPYNVNMFIGNLGITLPSLASDTSGGGGSTNFDVIEYGADHQLSNFHYLNGQLNYPIVNVVMSDFWLFDLKSYLRGTFDIMWIKRNKSMADMDMDRFQTWSGFFDDGVTPWSITVVAP